MIEKIRNLKINSEAVKKALEVGHRLVAFGEAVVMTASFSACVRHTELNSYVEFSNVSSYSIVSGDTLSDIAADRGITVEQLLSIPGNEAYSKNPNAIYPGNVIFVPEATTEAAEGNGNICENQVGHLNPSRMTKDMSDEFAVFDVGNHEHIGVSNQSRKLKKAEKKDISRAVIISSEATDLCEIYDDIEYTKSVIKDNNIDMPVFLSIDNIMNDDDLSAKEKADMVLTFLKMAEENGMFVGVYGTSTNLEFFDKYCLDLSEYTTFVVKDGATEYSGNSSFVQDEEGNIICTYSSAEDNDNISNLIRRKGLNSSNNLRQNGYRVFGKNDDVRLIAVECGMSTRDLLKYNGLRKVKQVKPGMVLRIPSESQEYKVITTNPDVERQDTVVFKGIDTSYCQAPASAVDWDSVAKKVDFDILKICEQSYHDFENIDVDVNFEGYYNACREHGIAVGGYYITRATTVTDAVSEAKMVVDYLKSNGFEMDFPLFIDYENTATWYYEEEFNKIESSNNLAEIIRSVAEVFESAGYRFGIYSNRSTRIQIKSMAGEELINRYEAWIATNTEESRYNAVDDGGEGPEFPGYDTADIKQMTDRVTDVGVEEVDGCTDVDLCYKNYGKFETIQTDSEYTFEMKKFSRFDALATLEDVAIGGAIGGAGVMTLMFIHRKREKTQPVVKKK